jgi:hypothetical protein
MSKTPESMYGCLRQYRHNNSDGFVTGYDTECVDKRIAVLEKEKAALRADNISIGIRQFKAGMERAAGIATSCGSAFIADQIRKEIT